MSKVAIRKLASGVPGFDDVLGGGIPEYSLNLIVGGAGSGKTTLGHQIMFANATPERKAIFFTVMGEPPLKMLRYMQQLSFFDPSKVAESIRFVHLGREAREGGLTQVLARIVREVEEATPAMVVVDSFRAVIRRTLVGSSGENEVQDFTQRLALHLTACEATTFMLGEYGDDEQDGSLFTVADGIVRLFQAVDRNSVVRKLQVQKMRGQAQIPGLQTMRITDDGIRVFPRLLKPQEGTGSDRPLEDRLATGVPALDTMTGGGIPRGYSVLLAGPSGSGKTVLSNEFILEGIRRGEPGVIAVFEKRPDDYLHTTPHGEAFDRLIKERKLEVVYVRPLDLSIDETLTAIREAVLRIGARRAVIDSLSGLELALAPTFREDFRESLYRMVGALTGMGVTVMSTVELPDSFSTLQFSPHGIAFLCDAIIMQRYVEIDGQLRRVMSVVKVRGSQHSKDLREYEITSNAELVVGKVLDSYAGLLTGNPRKLGGPNVTQDERDADADLIDGGIVGLQRRANEQLLLAGIRAQEQLEDARESQRSYAEDTNVRQLREAELVATAEFRERMLSIIGHDLRNPLNAIIMACSVLDGRGNLNEADAHLVTRIVSSGQRMTRMISQLVGFTQATLGGDFELVLAPSDLGDVCRNIAEELRLSSSIVIDVTTDGDLTGIWDADRLAEVISNIAGNAVDHAAPGTPVLIHCSTRGDVVRAEITNRGVCISPEVLPLIFNAFRRGQVSEKANSGHLGLGLYIASQIAHSHGGTLMARSSDGSTTFTLSLPRGSGLSNH